jgi:hypothetical protein
LRIIVVKRCGRLMQGFGENVDRVPVNVEGVVRT